MQNGTEALSGIYLFSHGLLVKMLISHEPQGEIGTDLAYLYILTLSRHWFAKRWRGVAEHHSGKS